MSTHEIGARQRKQQADAPGIEQHGVKIELSAFIVQDGNRKRVFN